MFWSRGSSRQRKAVLSALSAVGETGMTLLALGLAVNIPEGRLHTILEGLVRSGQVRRRGTKPSAIPGPRSAHYHLALPRHSVLPGVQNRRATAQRTGDDSPQAPDEQSPTLRRAPGSTARRVAAPSAGIRTTRAQGV